MKKLLTAVFSLALILQGCSYFQPKTKTEGPEGGFGKSRKGDLIVTPAETAVTVQWGVPYEIGLDVSWAASQKLAVQLAVAEGTPDWLGAEITPSIIEPPGRAVLRLSPLVTTAKLGETDVVIEASAYGIREPLSETITVTIERQYGSFEYVETAAVTRECRNVCGKVKDGSLTFYDVLREKDQTCDDKSPLPESQKIGIHSFGLSGKGYGFGRTCKVAAIYQGNGQVTFFNLGLTDRFPRGAQLLGLQGVRDCWLSADNSVALCEISNALIPYDVVTGASLGTPCRMSAKPQSVVLEVGGKLSTDQCSWTIK